MSKVRKDAASVTRQFNSGNMPKGHKPVVAGKAIVRRSKKAKR